MILNRPNSVTIAPTSAKLFQRAFMKRLSPAFPKKSEKMSIHIPLDSSKGGRSFITISLSSKIWKTLSKKTEANKINGRVSESEKSVTINHSSFIDFGRKSITVNIMIEIVATHRIVLREENIFFPPFFRI